MRFGSALLALALAFGFSLPSTGASAAEAQPTRLAIVVPVTVPPEPTGLIPPERLESYTSPTGILTLRLESVANRPVTIAIDPMIIASIRILGSAAPESAVGWLSKLDDASNASFALSYADSDIAALSQAGSTEVLAPTSFTIDSSLFPEQPEQSADGEAAEPTATTSPKPQETSAPTSESLLDWPYSVDSVVWPRQATVTTKDLALFNAVAPVTTILGTANVESAGQASASVGDHQVLVSDDTVSDLLATASSSLGEMEWQSSMTALSAALVSKSAATSSTMLATLDRDPAESASRLAETITSLTLAADVDLVSLETAMAEDQAETVLVETPVDAERVSRLRLLLASEVLIGPFSTILDDPAALTGERRLTLLALASNSWVWNHEAWPEAVADWLERTNIILNSVHVAKSSTLNFFQDKGNLVIAVSNALDFPVTVNVTVRSDTGILVILDSSVPLSLEPQSQNRALIPVQSIANGEVALQVSLSGPTGVAVSSPRTVKTNVIAGWETAATWVITVILFIIFIAGIVRTVLRRKRLNQAEEQDSVELRETGE